VISKPSINTEEGTHEEATKKSENNSKDVDNSLQNDDDSYLLINDNVNDSFNTNIDDEYEPMKMKYPSSNLTEPTPMEEKTFEEHSVDLTMENLNESFINNPDSPSIVKTSDNNITNENFQDEDFEVVVDGSINHKEGDIAIAVENNKNLVPIENNEKIEKLNASGENKSSNNTNILLEGEGVNNEMKLSRDTDNDDDIDLDTVLVETEEVTKEEIDPETSNKVMVTQMIVTEIESSLSRSQDDTNEKHESYHDKSINTSSITTYTVEKEIAIETDID